MAVVLGRGGKSERKAKRWCLAMRCETVLKLSLHMMAHMPLLFFFFLSRMWRDENMCDNA